MVGKPGKHVEKSFDAIMYYVVKSVSIPFVKSEI